MKKSEIGKFAFLAVLSVVIAFSASADSKVTRFVSCTMNGQHLLGPIGVTDQSFEFGNPSGFADVPYEGWPSTLASWHYSYDANSQEVTVRITPYKDEHTPGVTTSATWTLAQLSSLGGQTIDQYNCAAVLAGN